MANDPLSSARAALAREVPLRTRLFLAARWRLTPYAAMASRLPRRGSILDLGCGHGLLALTAAASAPERSVLGIDHDEERVRIGLRAAAAARLPNVRLEVGSMFAPPSGRFQGIAMIDVLHYFSEEEQARLAGQASAMLEPGGILLVREVDPQRGAVSAWNRVYEKLATGSGFTRTDGRRLHFRTPARWTALLEGAGFRVDAEPCSSPLFADVLFVCARGA